ncbi:uncharacterized protein Triagg1_1396 [Trichoderma aggressivum f. europaeum]|uniref:DNA2/NAM7 helicase-like C-terminal domain-containing protein n=1 Tax=Trichoderma aggressivum f. europaeum TaxID=173218 RepID=A0AAE1JGW8_9HYPO|nr:hypothetical protein Triagg1_1396 [Trichoderma aggressivum f. europaeum]
MEPALAKSLPERGSKFSMLEIDLGDGPDPVVLHFGMPFDNPGHPGEGWIKQSQPIAGSQTLLDALSQRTFRFVVDSPVEDIPKSFVPEYIPSPFSYPYGTDHSWNLEHYYDMLSLEKGSTFERQWSFQDHNDHLAVMTQSQVQDFVWLHEAAREIFKQKSEAYFVSTEGSLPPHIDEFYVIMQPMQSFLRKYGAALRCLLNSDTLYLYIYDPTARAHINGTGPAKWPARVVHISAIFNPLVHQGLSRARWVCNLLQDQHLILTVRRPKERNVRPSLNVEVLNEDALQMNKKKKYHVRLKFLVDHKSCQRKVEAVLQFDPKAARQVSGATSPMDFNMSLHRDLLLGNGFFETYKSLRERAETQPWMRLARNRPLPAVNLLPESQNVIDALMEDVVPSDRKRLCTYLSRVPLGFGLVTGDPGFGKTTVLSVATLGMFITLGPIYACAATDAAADNFAEHLHRISERFTCRLNEAKGLDGSRANRILIVRGYDEDDEVAAFQNLLERPRIGDQAASLDSFDPKPKWRLRLSLAFWLLVALRSPASYLDSQRNLRQLRDVATGAISHRDYRVGRTVDSNLIKAIFKKILRCTNILCTNISLSGQGPYERWMKTVAKGIAVDEANNVSRPDLYSVWGNKLRPCLICGDDKQLEPRLVSFGQRDEEGHSMNRFEQDGKISALLFFKCNGWPVFRLRTQLRMAAGLFDLCHDVVIGMPDPYYGPNCDISLDRHACGRELEAFLQKRFPKLAPPPEDKLAAAFINCTGSQFHFNTITGSGCNPVQSWHALDFVRDLVTQTMITPADIFIITPYEANVDFIEGERQKSWYSAISSMAPAATVDDFQGRQGNIIILVAATTQDSEPGYISDIHYLCVMLSRHISGLVIFGDHSFPQTYDTTNARNGELETDDNPMILNWGRDDNSVREGPGWRNMLSILMRKKRVATLPVPEPLDNTTSDVS